MSLEWQQLVTHAIGFLITLWLLKKFAWGPLMSMMEERRDKIATEFRTIDDEKAAVARLTEEYEKKMQQIEQEKRQKLLEAVNEGKKIAEDIKASAQQDARELREKARADIESEVAKAKVQLRDDMVAITVTAAEKIIRERLDDAKHRELIGNFIDNAEKA